MSWALIVSRDKCFSLFFIIFAESWKTHTKTLKVMYFRVMHQIYCRPFTRLTAMCFNIIMPRISVKHRIIRWQARSKITYQCSHKMCSIKISNLQISRYWINNNHLWSKIMHIHRIIRVVQRTWMPLVSRQHHHRCQISWIKVWCPRMRHNMAVLKIRWRWIKCSSSSKMLPISSPQVICCTKRRRITQMIGHHHRIRGKCHLTLIQFENWISRIVRIKVL